MDGRSGADAGGDHHQQQQQQQPEIANKLDFRQYIDIFYMRGRSRADADDHHQQQQPEIANEIRFQAIS